MRNNVSSHNHLSQWSHKQDGAGVSLMSRHCEQHRPFSHVLLLGALTRLNREGPQTHSGYSSHTWTCISLRQTQIRPVIPGLGRSIAICLQCSWALLTHTARPWAPTHTCDLHTAKGTTHRANQPHPLLSHLLSLTWFYQAEFAK